jgi:hypothetical protein
MLFIVAWSACNPVLAAEHASGDIFSTPDTQLAPTFKGRKLPDPSGDPLIGPGGDFPGRDALRAIPSMSGKQLGAVDHVIFSNRDTNTALQEELASLKRLLERRKVLDVPPVIANSVPLAPDVLNRGGDMQKALNEQGTDIVYAGEPDEAINARIQMLTQQLAQNKESLWPSLRSVLTADQLRQLQLMKSGRLMISSDAPTDIPPPEPPAPKPNAAKPIHAPNTVPHGSNMMPHLASPVIYTTKQLLYHALWRL